MWNSMSPPGFASTGAGSERFLATMVKPFPTLESTSSTSISSQSRKPRSFRYSTSATKSSVIPHVVVARRHHRIGGGRPSDRVVGQVVSQVGARTVAVEGPLLVRDDQKRDPADLEHPVPLPERPQRVGHVLHDVAREHELERAVGDGHAVGRGQDVDRGRLEGDRPLRILEQGAFGMVEVPGPYPRKRVDRGGADLDAPRERAQEASGEVHATGGGGPQLGSRPGARACPAQGPVRALPRGHAGSGRTRGHRTPRALAFARRVCSNAVRLGALSTTGSGPTRRPSPRGLRGAGPARLLHGDR